MIQNTQIKILWLTDIHFSDAYGALGTEDSEFTPFLEGFVTWVNREHKKHALSYIFITGDLAQRGTLADYDLLKKNSA